MESSAEHPENISSEKSEEKAPDVDASPGDVTTSEASKVTGGGDATSVLQEAATNEGQSSGVSDEKEETSAATASTGDTPGGESTLTEDTKEEASTEPEAVKDKDLDEDVLASETAGVTADSEEGGETADQEAVPEVTTDAPSDSVQESEEKLDEDVETVSQEEADEKLSDKSEDKSQIEESTDAGVTEALESGTFQEESVEDTAEKTSVQTDSKEEEKNTEEQDSDDGSKDDVDLLSDVEEEKVQSTGAAVEPEEDSPKEDQPTEGGQVISKEDTVSKPEESEPTSDEDTLLKEDKQTGEEETTGVAAEPEEDSPKEDQPTEEESDISKEDSDSKPEIQPTGDEDALLKEDKQTGGETAEDITAAEEDALLKDTEEVGEEKMEDEAMEVEESAGSQADGDKQEDDVESMEVDDEPKDAPGDVEMQSEPGSVTQDTEQVGDKETEMESETKPEEDVSGTKEEDKSETVEDDEDKSETHTKEKTSDKNEGDVTEDPTTAVSDKSDESLPRQESTEVDKSGSEKGDGQDKTSAIDSPLETQEKTTTEETADKEVEGDKEADKTAEEDDGEKTEKSTDKQQAEEVEASEVEKSTEKTKEDSEASETSKSTEKEQEETSEDKTAESKPVKGDTADSKDDAADSKDDAADSKDDAADSKDDAADSKAAEESSKDEPQASEDADSGSSSRDTSKSPLTAGADKKAVAKKGKLGGFSLGNIVSQLKKRAEKDEAMEGVQEGEATPASGEKESEPETPKKDAAADKKDSTEEVATKESDKPKEVTSPTKDTPPAGSSRRKQNKSSAQHITKDKEGGSKEGDKEDDDDDIVEIVDGPNIENEGQMKNYATDTMNELLGMFGFDKVDQQDTQALKLGDKFSAKAPPVVAVTKAPSAPAVKAVTTITAKDAKAKVPEKKVHCTECKQPITSKTNLGWGSQPFCSPNCLTNFQNRQTSICEYCNGLISQAARGKFTKDMQTGQRKEFCSQGCVTEFTKRLKTCSHCAKELKAAEMIVAPVGTQNKFKEFCNQGCVDAHELKRQALSKTNSNKGNMHPCAVCSKKAKVKHEINFQNVIHRLCSNECFSHFRTKHSLALNFCEQCGVICYNENLVPNVLIDGKMRRFCSQRCVGEYKVKHRRQVPCFNCKMPSTNHNMIEETGPSGDIRLFCTMQCLQKARSKPQTTPTVARATTAKAPTKAQQSGGLSGVSQTAPCDHCNKNQRPLYHLTMSDNTIRNFCSYPCVIAFQAQFNVPPVTLPQETLMLKCAFCSTGFIHKPLTLEYKGSISLFCTQGCFDEFKRSNSVVMECDYCHLEKILHDRSFFSGMAKSFCSEGCKLLFKQQFAQRLGLKCIVCDYCAQTCRSTVEMVYNKTRRRFCGIACRDKYDKWFNKTARCDGCKLMGRTLSETFMWRDEIKKVCDQKCLLLFYTQQNIPNMTTQGQIQIQGGTQQPVITTKTTKTPPGQQSTTPVIANVMSLASLNQQQSQQPTTTVTKTIYRSPAPVAKATKQTQITTAPPKIKPPPPPPAPLPPAPKMVRNKITLCKPFTQTKSVSCRPVHQHKSCQTDGPRHPIFVPVPVPIFIPVPMHMYTTPVPFPVGISTPVPVPMFIPVAAGNADRLIKTMKEIREKTPSDPLEAELLMMADAIAGEDPKDDNSSSVAPDEDSNTTQGEVTQQPETDIGFGAVMNKMADFSAKEEQEDASSITMEEAEDIIPSDILAENILQMAAEMTNVLGQDQDLQEDIAVLQAPDRPPTPVKPKSRRPKRRGKGGRNKRYIVDNSDDEANQPGPSVPALSKSKEEAKKSVGINAFRGFIQAKLTTMSEREKKRNKMLRPEVLDCATEELYYGLCMFVKEARQPNGDKFSPDMLLLIFLSIQRELFDNERPENIFTDYEQFTQLVHKEVKDWKPIMDPVSDLVTNSLVDEETLWNSKQLGAHSPYILLSTLLYFNTKCFRLNGVEQHKELAFVRVQKHLRKTDSGRTMYLRYFPKEMMKKLQGSDGRAGRKRERDDSLDLPEQCENTDNPLRCPVKLYEFYLSKCPESVKTRTDLFYLVPERSCIPDSPVWYTCIPLPDKDMNHILSRIMLTKDVHESWAVAANQEEQEYDSD